MSEELRMITIKDSEFTSKETLLRYIADALDFPDYFGMNYDAFNDCLGDIFGPLMIEFICEGDDFSSEEVRTVYQIAKEIAEWKKDLTVICHKQEGETEVFECGFIYVAPGLDPEKQCATIPSTDINMTVIGCANYDQAEEAAKELVAKGCTAVELCAGFGNEGIARIKKAVGPGIAVGAVKFDFHPAFEFKSGDDMFQ